MVGVTQDPESLALRPKIGWAVREIEKLDALLARLAKEHVTFPGIDPGSEFPEDLAKFSGELPKEIRAYFSTGTPPLLAALRAYRALLGPVRCRAVEPRCL